MLAWGVGYVTGSAPLLNRIRRNIVEARGAHAVVDMVLWEAVPNYLRKLDAQCRVSLGKPLPIDVVPVKFASWIGGDHD